MSYKNELSLIWKIFLKAFKWDKVRFCSSIYLQAALNWLNMVRDDDFLTGVKRLFFIRIVQTKKHFIWCKLGNRNQWGFFWVLKLHIFLHIFLHIAKPSLVHKMYLLTGAGYKSEGDIKFCSVSERINRKYRCLGVRILQNGNGRETGLQSLRFWEKVFSWIKFFFPLKLRISQTIFSYFTVSKNYGSMKITTSSFLEKIKSKLSSFKRVSPFFILIMTTKKREDK